MEISIKAASLLLSVMTIALEIAMASVTMTQSNSEVIVGGTAHISCVTSLPKDIYWLHFPAGGPAHQQKEVYAYGKMHSPYKDRCEMQMNRTTGFYQLVIPRVELTDAGVFTCQEDEGIGDSAQAELTVLEAGPTCTSTKSPIELIGPNSCNKEQENLTLACSVAYRGNIRPVLEWEMVGSNDTVTQGLNIEKAENRVTSHLTMSSQPALDGSSYICQTTKTQYNCTSDVINIIYVISSDFTQKATIGDTVVCTANTNESCSYRWKWFKGDDTLTVSNSQTLIPKQAGNFRCEAECIVGKDPCTITAMYAYIEDGNATSTAGAIGSTGTSDISLLWLLVFIIPLVVVLVYYLWKKNCTPRAQPERPQTPGESLELMPNGTNRTDEDDAIRRAFYTAPYIGKGLSGCEIHGPMQYKDIQCTCERITCTQEEVEVAKELEIANRSQKWMALKHENLITFHDVILKSPDVYIMMEYAAGGSVRDALKECTKCEVDLPMNVVKDWAKQIANGMGYLHEEGIVHRNLNSVRILIMESFEAPDIFNKSLKISQFCLTDESHNTFTTHAEMKFGFSAPEVFDGTYEKHGDVWSFGIVIWEMLTKRMPYKEEKVFEKIRDDIRQGAKALMIQDSWPNALKKILEGCRSLELSERPAFSDIVESLLAWQLVNSPE